MSVWFRGRATAPVTAERRDGWPIVSAQAISAALSGGGSYQVSVSSVEQAQQSIAIRAAMDLIASLGSELPMHVYSGEGSSRRKRVMPGYLEDPSGDGNGLPDWSYQVLMSWLGRGNLYGHVLERAPAGYPTQVLPLYPDSVTGVMIDGAPKWYANGARIDDPRDLLHARVNPVPGVLLGQSPIALHATQIGLSLTATKFGNQWFADGAHPGAILTNTEIEMTPPLAKVAKERFMAAVRGSREPVVLGKGWEYKQIQLTPDESQFLETQGYSEAQCARIFGPGIAETLGYESGGSLTYSNVESRASHLLIFAVNKWLRRLERLLTSMLPRPQYVVIDRDGLLQSTTLERYRAHAEALKNNWKVINEVREDEDLVPVPWGDEPYAAAPEPAPEPEPEPTGAEAPPKDA